MPLKMKMWTNLDAPKNENVETLYAPQDDNVDNS